MTTALIRQAGSNPCPPTHPSEAAFESFLDAQSYAYLKEKITFPFEKPKRGRTPRGVTPDYQILGRADGTVYSDLFIEICEADRFLKRSALPLRVQRKNLRTSDSRKAFIMAAEYLKRKRARMRRAEQIYGVTILVVTYAEQQVIFERPELFDAMIQSRLAAITLRRAS
ncbi:MAG: hypothetical protein ABIS59_01705 [Candidatus Saccharibacteria bacterium]